MLILREYERGITSRINKHRDEVMYGYQRLSDGMKEIKVVEERFVIE